ncbi:RNA methyltransferase [Candidatus Dependentiae bacterium]|nr:RNA methyltransferase [Candidatus Dependentiae bacterium]
MKFKKTNNPLVQKYTDFIYGIHPIIELLAAKRRKIGAVYTVKPFVKAWDQIKSLLPDYVPVHIVSRDVLTKMAGIVDHQGILAYVAPFPYAKQMFAPEKHPFLLVLDGVQDVRNLGAIIRSAYCAGVDGIILSKRGGTLLTAAAIKASAGLSEHVDIFIGQTIQSILAELQKKDYSLYLATLGQGHNAITVEYKQPLALVIGSEETGISSSVFKLGIRILLPQRREDISYNASVAAGILLFLIGVKIQKI